MNTVIIGTLLFLSQADLIISADDSRSQAVNSTTRLVVSGECGKDLIATEIINRGESVTIMVNGQLVESKNGLETLKPTQIPRSVDSAKIFCSAKNWEIGYLYGYNLLFRIYGDLTKK